MHIYRFKSFSISHTLYKNMIKKLFITKILSAYKLQHMDTQVTVLKNNILFPLPYSVVQTFSFLLIEIFQINKIMRQNATFYKVENISYEAYFKQPLLQYSLKSIQILLWHEEDTHSTMYTLNSLIPEVEIGKDCPLECLRLQLALLLLSGLQIFC